MITRFFILLFKWNGWKIVGTPPADLKKAVVIGAPHTSSWDFIYALAIFKLLKLKVRYLIKKEMDFFPMGILIRNTGGIPVDRKKSKQLTDTLVSIIEKNDEILVAMSAEGTRKKVYKLRTGFYHIAKKANVPVVMVAMDFFNRTVVFTEPFFLSDDEQADKRKIIDFFKDFKGFVPEYSITADIEC
jgi:1-acyl-sn-glycerol-3-phosphate acyltransferase